MRQIGDDFKADPFKPMITKPVEAPSNLSQQQLASLQQYQRNSFLKYAYDHCGKQTERNNMAMSAGDKETFNQCVNKFRQAVLIFNEEKSIFVSRLDEIKASGGDIYSGLNQY